jgi:septum site-determining protein MinC
MAISFEGRILSNDEQRAILDIIEQNTDMHIVCVMENDPAKEEYIKRPLSKS